jgi:hypothetical protein
MDCSYGKNVFSIVGPGIEPAYAVGMYVDDLHFGL